MGRNEARRRKIAQTVTSEVMRNKAHALFGQPVKQEVAPDEVSAAGAQTFNNAAMKCCERLHKQEVVFAAFKAGAGQLKRCSREFKHLVGEGIVRDMNGNIASIQEALAIIGMYGEERNTLQRAFASGAVFNQEERKNTEMATRHIKVLHRAWNAMDSLVTCLETVQLNLMLKQQIHSSSCARELHGIHCVLDSVKGLRPEFAASFAFKAATNFSTAKGRGI